MIQKFSWKGCDLNSFVMFVREKNQNNLSPCFPSFCKKFEIDKQIKIMTYVVSLTFVNRSK